jgi:Family of unknown function (DUF5681)
MPKFQKGQSGNPGGRPKVVGEVQELAREHTAESISTLVEIMRNKKAPPAARAVAANSILDRGYGRPAQTLEASIRRGSIREMTDEELMAIASSDEPDVSEAPTEH